MAAHGETRAVRFKGLYHIGGYGWRTDWARDAFFCDHGIRACFGRVRYDQRYTLVFSFDRPTRLHCIDALIAVEHKTTRLPPVLKITVPRKYYGHIHLYSARALAPMFPRDGSYNVFAWLEVDGTH